MARALARGWGRPVLCADPVAERAAELAQEMGGRALGSNAEVAAQADLGVLCHKPAQLESVAAEIEGEAKTIASILDVTPLARLKHAYPGRPVYRFIPSLPVEVRAGAVVQAAGETQAADMDAKVHDLFAELGAVVTVDDSLVDVAMGLMSCAPAYVALVAGRLEAAAGLPGPKLDTLLQRLPGVGPWSSAEVRQRACGDADAVSVGDYHLPSVVGWALAGRVVDDAGMLELLASYRGHRHRAAVLAGLSGRRPPRRGPRLAARDYRAF